MYLAKRDFKYRNILYKKGMEVRVSTSIAKKLLKDGSIKIKVDKEKSNGVVRPNQENT
jgi:hypothetical protein